LYFISDEKSDYKEFSIRIPVELDEKIEIDRKLAKPKRSKNSQVNFIIENYYEKVLATSSAAIGVGE
jgi:predicted DNA-binding protein